MINLDEIEAKAKAATPGPWKWDGEGDLIALKAPTHFGDTVKIVIGKEYYFETDEDRDHIATMSPTLILEWVAETRRLRKAVVFGQGRIHSDICTRANCVRECIEADQALKGSGT